MLGLRTRGPDRTCSITVQDDQDTTDYRAVLGKIDDGYTACLYALWGKSDIAMRRLAEAVGAGYSHADLMTRDGVPVDRVIEKRGPGVPAARKVPAATKLKLAIPEHLQVVDGSLGDLEAILGSCVEGADD